MKLLVGDDERTPQQFSLRRCGPNGPLNGPRSSLAGVAEPGDRLDVLGFGSYVNRGSKASPCWEKVTNDNPLDGVRSAFQWQPLGGGDG